jgi:hypothetical protein
VSQSLLLLLLLSLLPQVLMLLLLSLLPQVLMLLLLLLPPLSSADMKERNNQTGSAYIMHNTQCHYTTIKLTILVVVVAITNVTA